MMSKITKGLKSKVESHQIGFTSKQYQTLLALLQQSKFSRDNICNQLSIIPSNMTTHLVMDFFIPLVFGFLITSMSN